MRGTAGSGKSTTARKFAMNLVAEGYRVAWIDRTNEVVYSELRSDIIKRKINTLVIDDAEGQSIGLFNIISELIIEGIIISALCVVDTSRKANEIKSVLGVNINFTELVIPYLTKNDAQRLVDALEKDGKIGELSRLKPAERSLKLLEGSESQLLVAMIRAVSNERFDVKVRKEYTSLLDLEKRIYSLACIATLGGSSLYFRDFVQLIKNDPNSIMAHIEHLLQSGLLVHETGSGDRIRARHRVIAAEVRKKIADDGHLQNVLESLGWLLGMTISNPPKSSQRNFRLFKWLMNHRVICEQLGIVGAREFYGKILETSRHLAHFWLQRGAFEAQFGEIDLAENYLRQALAKSPRDPQILTEWYFIRLRKACSDPKSDGSKEAAVEAISGLKTLIADRGSIDRYPYHVLGSQGFSWLMKGELSISEKKDLRTELVILLEEGYLKHNGADDLKVLLSDIQRKTLGF